MVVVERRGVLSTGVSGLDADVVPNSYTGGSICVITYLPAPFTFFQ